MISKYHKHAKEMMLTWLDVLLELYFSCSSQLSLVFGNTQHKVETL